MAETKTASPWLSWILTILTLLSAGGGGFAASSYLEAKGDSPASVVVKAPESARVGQLVVLDASESYVDAFKWEVTPKTDNFVVIEDGKKAFFSGEKPGNYTFWVAGAADKTVDLKSVTITIEGVVPPDPGPTGLDAKIRQWLKLVKSDTWAQEANALGASFRSVSLQITSGIIKTPEDVIKATKISNQATLGAKVAAWDSTFGQELRKELNSLSAAGKLPDAASHAALWLQIGEILEKVANEGKR
jgi:hypothetical protein